MNLKGIQDLWGTSGHNPGNPGSPVILRWLCHEAELFLQAGTGKIKDSLEKIQDKQFPKHCMKGVVRVLLLQQSSNAVVARQRWLIYHLLTGTE